MEEDNYERLFECELIRCFIIDAVLSKPEITTIVFCRDQHLFLFCHTLERKETKVCHPVQNTTDLLTWKKRRYKKGKSDWPAILNFELFLK